MQIVQVPDPNLLRCESCGEAFVRIRSTQRYCSDESCRKKRAAAYTRSLYWADPVAARAKLDAWHTAHPGRQRATVKKSRTFPCSSCGKLITQAIRKELRSTYLCGVCRDKANLITRPCWWCERPVSRVPSRAKALKRIHHPKCGGQEFALSIKFHVSRERMRQLIEKFKTALPELSREQIGAALRLQAYGKARRWVCKATAVA